MTEHSWQKHIKYLLLCIGDPAEDSGKLAANEQLILELNIRDAAFTERKCLNLPV